MKRKNFFKWIYEKVSNYNLFMLEENDYDDNTEDPVIVLKHQKYKTWLYITLRTVCLYILFYVTLIKIEPKTVVISNITPDLFNKLSSDHGQTLSCPCKTITIPYKSFVTHKITMHPICSSIFIDKQWIEGLYFANASEFGVWDFRTTAYSQFKLLSKFNLLSNEIINQIRKTIDNTDLISIELIAGMKIQKEVDDILELQKDRLTPLESLLAGTLDCFYDFNCIQLLLKYFPNLNQTYNNLNNSILSSGYKNISIINYLNRFFIENWSLEIDYLSYFSQCSPSMCSTFALCLFTSLRNETVTKYERNPTLKTYSSLEIKNLSALRCPCSNKTISYKNFLFFSPIFHQICSSSFVHNSWIEIIKSNAWYISSNDWRSQAYSQFQILSDLCQLANKTIVDAIDQFLNQFFIASSMMNEMNFIKQLNATLNQFYYSTVDNFSFQKDIVSLIMQVDQFYKGYMTLLTHDNQFGLNLNIVINKTNNHKTAQFQFMLNEIPERNSSLGKCNCVINPHCKIPAFIQTARSIYNIDGWFQGCLAMDSLLFSTFQCLYKDSDCFPIVLSYLDNGDEYFLDFSSSFNLQPLVYDPTASRYPPNTSFSIIIEELMIEQWNPVLSYELFYKSCAPLYCSYSQKIRKTTFIGVIITLVSMLGGIVVSLRILTPYLVNLSLNFLKIFKRKTNQKTEVRLNFLDRSKRIILNLIKRLRTTIVELNIFTIRHFGTNVDRITAKHYGQLATRLYLILFTSGISILIFYGMFQPYISTENFNKPSFIVYSHLRTLYGDDLRCTCSIIASKYDQFVEIKSSFHSICSSEFVLEKWQLDLVNGLIFNITLYEQRDYRRFLSAHLQYLQELCQLSIKSVNNTINEFLTSLFVTTELLSESNFHNHINILIEHKKSNAPVLFLRLLFFTQSIFYENAFISTYGTNVEFITEVTTDVVIHVPGKAVIYDDECSCGISPNCTSQATFIEKDFSKKIPINGMKIGCTPSQSFLSSTLECFYNQSCLNLIQQYTNYKTFLKPLSKIDSRFSQNTTVRELINHLFIEDWFIDKNYSLYYEQCSPLICSYTRIEELNIFYIITLILGLQGGLTIVLKWIFSLTTTTTTNVASIDTLSTTIIPVTSNTSG
ncbi:hypothetical protein I4U23_027565 [Adineta vaga]|nr:hypothetical protein I4U23_027565 [Adineta vaga]